jgi:hypothetical protein
MNARRFCLADRQQPHILRRRRITYEHTHATRCKTDIPREDVKNATFTSITCTVSSPDRPGAVMPGVLAGVRLVA